MGKPYSTRRHWVINRNTTSRQKGKEKEDEQQESSDPPVWQTPREPHTVDFGTFSILGGALAEEMRKRGLSNSAVNAVMEVKEDLDEEVNLHLIRSSLDLGPKMRDLEEEEGNSASMQEMDATNLLINGYWTTRRVVEAEEYLRDVVYGGVDGFAYVRSLAEFVDGYDEVCTSTNSLLSMDPYAR
jgi:bromodomain-containing protein 7/9